MGNQLLSEEEYAAFRSFLEEASGILLGDNKHYLVSSRLKGLMAENNIASFGELLQALKRQSDSKLRHRIVDAMTTNETMWFRDVYPYEVLKEVILPEYAAKRAASLRIWSAAASTGQEPYSISITVQEFVTGKLGMFSGGVSIAATDISPTVLNAAKAGVYDNASVVRGLSEERRDRFFVKKGEQWELKPELRNRVTFSELNLLGSYSRLGKFDIIFCRNVLIYFSHERKADILDRMAQTLNPGGYLILGSSEAPTSYSAAYQMIRTPKGVIYRLKAEQSNSSTPVSA